MIEPTTLPEDENNGNCPGYLLGLYTYVDPIGHGGEPLGFRPPTADLYVYEDKGECQMMILLYRPRHVLEPAITSLKLHENSLMLSEGFKPTLLPEDAKHISDTTFTKLGYDYPKKEITIYLAGGKQCVYRRDRYADL
uniref:Uncharacterized protein n=1 Tax=Perkinsus marinus TaxID=31276 RepID=C9VXM4_9ALVE|nr:unknown protein [Perkinsus marinus]